MIFTRDVLITWIDSLIEPRALDHFPTSGQLVDLRSLGGHAEASQVFRRVSEGEFAVAGLNRTKNLLGYPRCCLLSLVSFRGLKCRRVESRSPDGKKKPKEGV